MKTSIPALLAVLFFAHSLARAEDYQFKAPFTRSGAFSPTGEITLENVNGSVEIRTWDKNEILIEGERSAKTDEELGLIDLKIDLSESRAGIKVRLPKRSGVFFSSGNIRAVVRFKVTVPATATLAKISTVNSSVLIEGARGRVNASSVNGGVRANGLAGPAKLETVNGAINARFDAVAAQQELSFKTVNGQVIVSLPKDAGVQLRGSVVNGSIKCDFPLELGQKDKRGRSLSGKIGDGRATLEAETVNGSVHIQMQ
jgi:Putative adhesin